MPDQKITLDQLLYCHYQHPNLEEAHIFLLDFGLHVAERSDKLIYYRGFGRDPYLYIAEQSPDGKRHFSGGGWIVASHEDLERGVTLPGASEIQNSTAPGGGLFVDVKDPNGVNLRLLYGVTKRSSDVQHREEPKPVVINSWNEKPRKGEFQRFERGPSKVHKLGHYGLIVDKTRFESTVSWYLSTFTLATTDSLYDKDSGKDMMTFMHLDKGEEYTDHHSFFIQSPPPPQAHSYPHHSSFEIDNMDSQVMGHYHLESQGWSNCWGIGRHLLGSQIFDYWFDPSGNIVEHYSDGDLVNSKTPIAREAAAQDTMAAWGPNVSLAFLTTRVEDLKKVPTASTTEHAAVAS